MPAIKGDMYINTHCNYSQPTLIKLDNENIGGHLTPLQQRCGLSLIVVCECLGFTGGLVSRRDMAAMWAELDSCV